MDPNPNEASVSPKQQAVERIRQAANVLVTVRSSPSVDELAACIGFTLMLNKLGKHATAVFSGQVPSTLEFLKPEQTLESNTDSLRDFIISLDKSKADKLRYKVEENVVRIFITPYRTSLTEKDLEFTQGDFNVDVVVALGVTQREELDQAIIAHGRILHDAAVVTMTAGQRESSLGSVNWQEPGASSLSEMLVSISEAFQGGLIDSQMATAFLTGIVAETERFSNPKTTPKVMTMSAQLMAAGANQQLIANELQKGGPLTPAVESDQSGQNDDNGSLSINHESPDQPTPPAPPNTDGPAAPPVHSEPFIAPPEVGQSFNPLIPQPGQQPPPSPPPAPPTEPILPPPPGLTNPTQTEGQIQIDQEGNLTRPDAPSPKHKIVQPLPDQSGVAPLPELPTTSDTPPTAVLPVNDADATLLAIEESVHSPHLQDVPPSSELDSARNAVIDAVNQVTYDPAHPEARADVGAQFGPPIQPTPGQATPLDSLRLNETPPPAEPQNDNQAAPPPVPPPMYN